MKENPMRKIRIGKVTVNIGLKNTGEDVDKAYKLLERLTGKKPVKTMAKKNAKTFGIRPGLNIGVKVTLRGKDAVEFLRRIFESKSNLSIKSFDKQGNFSFGIEEYLNVPGMKYDPKIGIMGFDVCVTLERPGFSIKAKKIKKEIGKNHRIIRDEAIEFVKQNFDISVGKIEKGDRFDL